MSKTKARTEFEEQSVADEYASLLKKFHPVFGDVDNIRVVKILKRIGEWQRLFNKNKGLKNEGVYRKKLFEDQKIAIRELNYYFSKQNGNVQ